MDNYDHDSTTLDGLEPYVWQLTQRGETVLIFGLAALITAGLLICLVIGQGNKAERIKDESAGLIPPISETRSE